MVDCSVAISSVERGGAKGGRGQTLELLRCVYSLRIAHRYAAHPALVFKRKLDRRLSDLDCSERRSDGVDLVEADELDGRRVVGEGGAEGGEEGGCAGRLACDDVDCAGKLVVSSLPELRE